MPALDRGEFIELQRTIARDGLQAVACGIRVLQLASSLIEVARSGLKAIAPAEAGYLDSLADRVLKEGIAPADILIMNYEGRWHGDIRQAIEYLRVV
jgi:gamma-glutamylcysteine synthetase